MSVRSVRTRCLCDRRKARGACPRTSNLVLALACGASALAFCLVAAAGAWRNLVLGA